MMGGGVREQCRSCRWADWQYVKAGLDDTKAALLVPIGPLTNDHKVMLYVESGQRESKESWGAILRDRRARGLKPSRCTSADGHLGIWADLGEQQPTAVDQRCWNPWITIVLDAVPTQHQAEARTLQCAMPHTDTQPACEELQAPFDKRNR